MPDKEIMPTSEIDSLDEESLKAQVSLGLDEARQFAETLDFDDVKSGQWFVNLLTKVVHTYNRNARATYFQRKYPGLPSDDIADILTSVTIRYAAIAGALTGVAAGASQIATLASAGMTMPIFLGSIGAEMLALSYIQMRLVLDLSVIYDLQLDPDDPEDVLMIFGYALGVTPTELVGKGLQTAAAAGAKGAVKQYISKGTLKAIQDFARRLGFKILQRTILKYAVPGASAAVGSGYNYVTTKSVGRIAKAHFKNRDKVTDELRLLVSRQNIYDLAFPAAAMYMAQVDGKVSPEERELYRAMLSRMSFDEHTQAEFQKLIADEETILEAVARIEDIEVRRNLVEVLALMAVYDGELAEKEGEFLLNVAARLNVPLDLDEVERRTQDYQIVVKKNVFERTAGVVGGVAVGAVGAAGEAAGSARDTATEVAGKVGGAAASAIGVAGQAANGIKGTAAETGGKVKDVFGRALKRKKDLEEETAPVASSTITCANCGREVPAEYRFCPGCGQPTATDKTCPSCDELIPIDFAFCPHCGAPQK
jgi:RNA polymerase subunit RPABC4/transcription elongation factor Spt4/tellurite resistance protein